ncbi:MAG: hypothetical protein ACXW00_00285 [Methylobacter sp.]
MAFSAFLLTAGAIFTVGSSRDRFIKECFEYETIEVVSRAGFGISKLATPNVSERITLDGMAVRRFWKVH